MDRWAAVFYIVVAPTRMSIRERSGGDKYKLVCTTDQIAESSSRKRPSPRLSHCFPTVVIPLVRSKWGVLKFGIDDIDDNNEDVEDDDDDEIQCSTRIMRHRAFSSRYLKHCQRTGFKLVDTCSRKKEAADIQLIQKMNLFALHNRTPSTIMLILVVQCWLRCVIGASNSLCDILLCFYKSISSSRWGFTVGRKKKS